MTKEFFEALFGSEPLKDEFIQVSFIDRVAKERVKGAAKPLPRHDLIFYVQSVAEVLKLLQRPEVLAGQHHTYFGAAPRIIQSGKKGSVAHSGCCWADIDDDHFGGDHAAVYATLEKVMLTPSMIVDTGHGIHAYWLLTEWIDAATVEILNKGLEKQLGGCAVWDATRLLRVPDSLNVKGGGRVPVGIAQSHFDRRYKASDISNVLRLGEDTRQTIRSGALGGRPSRSERDWDVIQSLQRLGVSNEGIKQVFEEQPVGDKYRESGESYMAHTLTASGQSIAIQTKMFFTEREFSYYAVDKQGEHRVSTFIIDPIRLHTSKDGDVYVCDVYSPPINGSGPQIVRSRFLEKGSLQGTRDINKFLTGAGWTWLGSDREVRLLAAHLYERWQDRGCPTAQVVNTIGRHEDYWVYPQGLLTHNEFMDPARAPLVYQPKAMNVEVDYSVDIPTEEYIALCHKLARLLPQINKPEIIWPIIGWFMACPYKPLLQGGDIRFPFLNLFGSTGSGKTSTLLTVFLPLSGYVVPTARDCSTTHFVLMNTLGWTNAVPVYLTEFRIDTLGDREYASLRRTLLEIYDRSADARGRPDLTVVEYKLEAPVILDGEDAMQDAAIMNRCVIVNPDPRTIKTSQPAQIAYLELTKPPGPGEADLQEFAGHYVQNSLACDVSQACEWWQDALSETQAALTGTEPSRVVNNIATCWFGIKRYAEWLSSNGVSEDELQLPPIETLLSSIKNVVEEKLGRTQMAIDDFVTDIINEVALHAPQHRLDFHYKYDRDKNILWFVLTEAHNWWAAKTRREGRACMTQRALSTQLDERRVADDGGPSPGQYSVQPGPQWCEGTARHMYGVSITDAKESGLDVGDEINLTAVTFVYQPTTQEEVDSYVEKEDRNKDRRPARQ